MQEIWKDIYFFNKQTNELIDYRGKYQVSNFGRLKSLDRYVRGFNHGVEFQSLIKGKIIKCRTNAYGYLLAHLAKDGKHRDYSLHRLVYFSFNPNDDTSLQVNHIDENKINCSLANLNLMSPTENAKWGTRAKRIREKIRGVSKGPMKEEHKAKISEGNKKSARHKAASLRLMEGGRAVLCMNDNGEVIKEYCNAEAAQRELGIIADSIRQCCKGTKSRIHAGGFKWRYEEERR